MATMDESNTQCPFEKGKGGLIRIFRAFRYSMEGFASALHNEAAFRQEALLAAILIPISLFIPVDWGTKALLIASVLLVLIVELLNSAIESVVDYISMERHPLAKRAKDMGSAAVFLSLVVCGVIWASAIWTAWSLDR